MRISFAALVVAGAALPIACSDNPATVTTSTVASASSTTVASASSTAASASNTAGAGTVAGSASACIATTAATGDVQVRVNDLVSGFGALGVRSPNVTAGVVRIAVVADAGNASAATVTVHAESATGESRGSISGVPAGTTCVVEMTLAAGAYVVTSDLNDGQKAGFEVGAAT